MTPSAHAITSAAPALPVPLPAVSTDSVGYRVSTMDLCAGLDVQALPLSALPHDTLRELLRLRSSWRGAHATARA